MDRKNSQTLKTFLDSHKMDIMFFNRTMFLIAVAHLLFIFHVMENPLPRKTQWNLRSSLLTVSKIFSISSAHFLKDIRIPLQR